MGVGVAVAAVVVIGLAAGLIYFFIGKRRRRQQQPPPSLPGTYARITFPGKQIPCLRVIKARRHLKYERLAKRTA